MKVASLTTRSHHLKIVTNSIDWNQDCFHQWWLFSMIVYRGCGSIDKVGVNQLLMGVPGQSCWWWRQSHWNRNFVKKKLNFHPFFISILAFSSFVRGAPIKKNFLFGRFLPNMGGWGGIFPNKVQTPQNLPKSLWKSPFSTWISPPKSHKKHGVHR